MAATNSLCAWVKRWDHLAPEAVCIPRQVGVGLDGVIAGLNLFHEKLGGSRELFTSMMATSCSVVGCDLIDALHVDFPAYLADWLLVDAGMKEGFFLHEVNH